MLGARVFDLRYSFKIDLYYHCFLPHHSTTDCSHFDVTSSNHTFKALPPHFEEGVTMTYSTSSALNHWPYCFPLCLHISSWKTFLIYFHHNGVKAQQCSFCQAYTTPPLSITYVTFLHVPNVIHPCCTLSL